MSDRLEIERKFLVRIERLPPLPEGVAIAQAYLGFEPVVRVRLAGGAGYLTVKGPGLLARREVELEIDPEAAAALFELRSPGTLLIRKTRRRILHGAHEWEIDRFEGPLEGLVVAEVELASVEAAPELPPWVGEEVTGDPAYQNANLARSGRPTSSTKCR